MYFPNFQTWYRGQLKLKKGLKMPNFPAAGTIIHSLQNPHSPHTSPSFPPQFSHLFPPPLSLPISPLKTLAIHIVFLHFTPTNLFFHPFQKSFLHFALHCDILYISLKQKGMTPMQNQQQPQPPDCLNCSHHLLEPDANPLYFRLYCQRYKRYILCEKLLQEINNIQKPRWCKKEGQQCCNKNSTTYKSQYKSHSMKQ